jgi:hypothetical protein
MRTTSLHNLYVLGAAPNSASSAALDQAIQQSLAVLQHIASILDSGDLISMGVRVHVHVVDLRDSDAAPRLKRLNIEQLPALITREKLYSGLDIIDVYSVNLRKLKNLRRGADTNKAPRKQANAKSGEEALEDMYNTEMGLSVNDPTNNVADVDQRDEVKMGEGSDMMDSYHVMMSRRDGKKNDEKTDQGSTMSKSKPSGPSGSSAAVLDSFSNSGGGGDFDEEDSAEDRQMSDSYWENQQSSM